MDNVRFAVCTTTVVGPHGVPVTLVEGRAYAADDSVVVALPHLFSEVPVVYSTFGAIVTPAGVEQATAAPGERRRRG